MPTRTLQMADLWELLTDAGPEDTCLVAGPVRHTRASLDARANQLARLLVIEGLAPGDRVAVLARNRAEYVEALLGCWKASVVPVNVNWRYTAAELCQVLDDAGAVAVIAEHRFVPVLAEAASELDALRLALVLEDETAGKPFPGSTGIRWIPWSEALDGQERRRPERQGRSADEHYILYTGGTTGMPRGVVWRHEDFFRACVFSGNPSGLLPVEEPEDIAAHATADFSPDICILAPLMHGGGQWPTLIALFGGGKAAIYSEPHFDPVRVLELVQAERPLSLSIVGDSMARPLAEAVLAAPGTYDVASLVTVANGGAMLTASVKGQLHQAFPGVLILDNFGASETGAAGREVVGGEHRSRPAFDPDPDTDVLDPATLEPLAAGSGEIGLLARRGHIPLGYWNDPVKTAATFRTDARGTRWVLPGDQATVEADGKILLLGRGSGCINSGGEKVFPEEVEGALRAHPAIVDAVVVGVPDDRFGQAVVAVVAVRDGAEEPDLEAVRTHCREHLAGYKLPRHLIVEQDLRTNTGKQDYARLGALAAARLGA